MCTPTAESHTFPWCFATHNGALEHIESCHTLVHDLVRIFLHEIAVILGQFLIVLVAYYSLQYEEYIYNVSSEKAQCFTKNLCY